MRISEKEVVELDVTKRSHPLLNPFDYLVAIAHLPRAPYYHEHLRHCSPRYQLSCFDLLLCNKSRNNNIYIKIEILWLKNKAGLEPEAQQVPVVQPPDEGQKRKDNQSVMDSTGNAPIAVLPG
jgi:hypothetical protein